MRRVTMKTATLDVEGMLSTLDYQGVEKQLARMPGVEQVSASVASNSATIQYDETVTSAASLKAKIDECGFHSGGQILPRHICKSQQAMVASPLMPMGADSVAAAEHTALEPHVHAPAGVPTAPAMPMSHDMTHGMGHGAGMNVQAMVRNFRNRFWICLIFSVPILLYSPLGRSFISLKPPFGMDLNLFLFILASAAIIYPGWPFVVGAVRALRNGVLNMAVLIVLSVGTGYLFSVGATFFFK